MEGKPFLPRLYDAMGGDLTKATLLAFLPYPWGFVPSSSVGESGAIRSTPCPDTHSLLAFSVLVKLDFSAGQQGISSGLPQVW